MIKNKKFITGNVGLIILASSAVILLIVTAILTMNFSATKKEVPPSQTANTIYTPDNTPTSKPAASRAVNNIVPGSLTEPSSNQSSQGIKTNEQQAQKLATTVKTFVLKSEFLKGDPTAQKIASGESIGVDITTFPLKAIRSFVSTDSFAYRVVSALRMLGYQEGLDSEAYVGQEFLFDFKRINNLSVSSMIDSATLQKIDAQLASREIEDQKLANQFPLYQYFMTAPKNEPTKEHAAAIFQIAFSALPSSLVEWNEINFKSYLRDQGGKQFSGLGTSDYKVCLSMLYQEVGDNCSLRAQGVSSFWGSDLAIAFTEIHEYSHFLDSNLYVKEADTSRGIIDTSGFYAISYDTSDTTYATGGGWKNYKIRRPNNAKNEFVGGYAMGWALSGKESDKYIRTAAEDFAESMATYVAEGRAFRELAKSYPVLSQKYDWLKLNVFKGREYNTGEIRGIAFMKANPSSLEVSDGTWTPLHFSTYLPDFAWDYKF